MKKRLNENNKLAKWHEEALLNRLKFTALNELGYCTTYNINNNGTLEELDEQINKLFCTL